jgi:hypothetical protein
MEGLCYITTAQGAKKERNVGYTLPLYSVVRLWDYAQEAFRLE